MISLVDFWFTERHRELLREADQRRLAQKARRARKGRSRAEVSPTRTPQVRAMTHGTIARTHPIVRLALARDITRIAELLELNGMPRWVAFEERFIVAEEAGQLAAVARFREGSESLHLGLIVTDPWAAEGPLVSALYAEARAVAEELGLREVGVRTREHQTHLREAGYRRWKGGWRLDMTAAAG